MNRKRSLALIMPAPHRIQILSLREMLKFTSLAPAGVVLPVAWAECRQPAEFQTINQCVANVLKDAQQARSRTKP